jgi:hypothetical protein
MNFTRSYHIEQLNELGVSKGNILDIIYAL